MKTRPMAVPIESEATTSGLLLAFILCAISGFLSAMALVAYLSLFRVADACAAVVWSVAR